MGFSFFGSILLFLKYAVGFQELFRFVEAVEIDVFVENEVAVAAAFGDLQLADIACFQHFVVEQFRPLKWAGIISCSVESEGWWNSFADVVGGGEFFPFFADFLLSVSFRRGIDDGEVEDEGVRQAGDCCIVGLFVDLVEKSRGNGEMASGGSSAHYDFIRIDAEFGGVGAGIADGRSSVFHAIEYGN